MTYKEALALKPNTVLYVKKSLDKFRVDSIDVDEAEKTVWVIGFVNGGIDKRHHTTLQFKK